MGKSRAKLWRLAACGLFVLSCLMAAARPPAWAAEKSADSKPQAKKSPESAAFQPGKKEPIFITSDWLEADRKKNTITYKGRVVAVQADMTMRSETLTAFYDAELKQLKEAVAEGKVHVTQGDRVATGAKAVFDGARKTITLTGSPVVRQGNNEVTGNRITFFIEEDRAVAERGDKPVTSVLFPEEFGKQEKGEASPSRVK